jgi:hypothetical protein
MAAFRGPGNLLELEEDKQLADLVKDWDFKKGRDFEDAVFANYRSSVHFPSSPRGAFHLLVVFRRYTFRLTDASVSMALHACLGGTPAGFHVQFFKEHHYCISVVSKRVGFAVTDIKHITTPHFDIYFHLWRDGGENWMHEFKKWQREEESSWQVVSRKKSSKKVSFARILNQHSPVRKSVPSELKNKIKFGRFSFELADAPSSFPAVFSNSNSSFRHNMVPRTLVASSTVFSHIKARLLAITL